jgi:hypothetical protein
MEDVGIFFKENVGNLSSVLKHKCRREWQIPLCFFFFFLKKRRRNAKIKELKCLQGIPKLLI